MVLDMTNQLIPHLNAASQHADCCKETLANCCKTLVNTFGVYWTKRGDLYNPATRCAIVRCMTNFILVCVCVAYMLNCCTVSVRSAECYCSACVLFRLRLCVIFCRQMHLQSGQYGNQQVVRMLQGCWMSYRKLCQTQVWL